MKKIKETLKSSYMEFRSVSTVTICAMLGGTALVMGYFTIQIGNFLKIGFSNLPNITVAYLFGPVVAPCFGAAMDVIKYIAKPTGPFFPGFTVTAILAGIINGFFLYGKPLRFGRIFLSELTVTVFCNIFLNTVWISMLYGNAFMVLLPTRVLKNLIQCPINSIVIFALLKTLEVSGIRKIFPEKNFKKDIDI